MEAASPEREILSMRINIKHTTYTYRWDICNTTKRDYCSIFSKQIQNHSAHISDTLSENNSFPLNVPFYSPSLQETVFPNHVTDCLRGPTGTCNNLQEPLTPAPNINNKKEYFKQIILQCWDKDSLIGHSCQL